MTMAISLRPQPRSRGHAAHLGSPSPLRFAAALIISTCAVARADENRARPQCDPAATAGWDRLVVPGERIGPLRLDGTIEDIVKRCGPGALLSQGGARRPQLFSTRTWDAIGLWVQFDEASRNVVWISIEVGGSNSWAQYGTSEGVRLGTRRPDLMSVMGPPERTVTAAGLTSLYYDRRGIRFTLADTGPLAGALGGMRVVWRSVPHGDTLVVPGQRISSVEVGMPLERALAALGGGYHRGEASPGLDLYYWPHLGLTLLEGAGLVRSVRVARHKAADAPGIRYSTTQDVGLGSSAAQIRAVFGERPKATPNAPDDEHWWIMRSRGIAFWVDDEGKVGSIDVFAPERQ